MAGRFDQQHDENRNVGVVDVEHQTCDGTQEDPLQDAAISPGLVPIPKEESDGKGGMGVRPGRIEVHVDGQRTGPPYGNGSERSPAGADILSSGTKGENDPDKTIESGTEGHGDAIRGRKAVGGDLRSKSASEQHSGVGDQQERCPQNCRADGEMIVEVAGSGAKFRLGQTVFVEASIAEAGIGVLVVVLKIETVLDQRSANESVVADAVAVDPRIQQGERKQEEEEKPAFLFARSRLEWIDSLAGLALTEPHRCNTRITDRFRVFSTNLLSRRHGTWTRMLQQWRLLSHCKAVRRRA